jgi:membrane protease YdiL (CAAX protease family)
MAHLATKRFNYWNQLAVLAAFVGVGLIIGGAIASILPFFVKMGPVTSSGKATAQLLDNLLKPENAALLRWITFIAAFFMFFLPTVLYALICHKKPFVHLGFKNNCNIKSVGVVVLIMLAALPLVSALQDLTSLLPWSKATILKFKEAEDAYNQQVAVIARMDNFADYLISVLVIAFLPAVFEETLFRGGIQNLFSRWFKKPLLAIVVTSIIFSAIHGSYLGFLSRFTLGFVLGWMYCRTGNIWLNIIGHFFNNAFAVTAMYLFTKPGEHPDPSKMEGQLPLWVGLASILALYGLFSLFNKVSENEIDQPGEEVLMPGVDAGHVPFN